MEHRNINSAKPAVILFDVYDTVLDMSDVERRVNHIMDSTRGYVIWFELFMQYCFVDNCTRQFNGFTSIAKATMSMAANSLGHKISDDDINDALEMLKHLPVHDGVANCLSALTDEGYRIAALTNSPQKIILERMEKSGLVSYFEQVLSAEHVKKYKPCIGVYEWATKKLQTPAQEILLVSSHSWDIAGGANAGMQTAFIQRQRQLFYPLATKPDFISNDFNNLVSQLRVSVKQ